MVVESDESDGTFVKLPADIVVVTNIDPEHLDHYGTFDAVREAFRAFVENVPFYGFAVMCLDHPEVQALVARIEDRRIVTYGRNPQAEVRFRDVAFRDGKTRFAVDRRDRVTGEAETIEDLAISMPGEHNVSNATAAVAVARGIGISADAIRRGLASFGGVKRRFTHTGTWNGVDIYDDYGHHPVEIAAVLRAARSATQGRIIAVRQPHRYTRLSSLFAEFCTCFNEADTVIVADVYPAGEAPIEGANRDALVEGLRAGGHRDARALEGEEALPALIASIVAAGRHGGVPRRGVDHQVGERVAGGAAGVERESGDWLRARPALSRRERVSPKRRVRGYRRCDGLLQRAAPHPAAPRPPSPYGRRLRARCAMPEHLLDRLRDKLAGFRGTLQAGPAAGADRLVPRRRAGGDSGHAGRRGGPRLPDAGAAGGNPGHRLRARLEPPGARRRRGGRRRAALGARLRQGRGRGQPHPRRRGARRQARSRRMRWRPASAASPSITAFPAASAARSA